MSFVVPKVALKLSHFLAPVFDASNLVV